MVALALTASAGACSSDPEPTVNAPYEGGTDAGEVPACRSCAEQACLGQAATCAGDPACVLATTCSAKRGALDACAAAATASCGCGFGSKCPVPIADASAPDADAADAAGDAAVVTMPTCSACIASQCGDPKKPCAIGSECDRFLGCAYACTDAACVNDCGARHATGQNAAADLASCTVAACSAACGL